MRKDDTDSYGADQIEEDDPSTDPSSTPAPDPATATDPTSVQPLASTDPNFNPNVNTPTTWDPNTKQPKDTFPGWHWDPTMARYMKDQEQTQVATQPATPPAPTTAPPPAAAAATPPAVPSGGVPAASAAPAAAATPPTVSTPTSPNAGFNNSIRQSLLDAIGKSSKPVSADDPEVSGAILANKVSNERSLEQERTDIAERLGTQGLSGSGALDTQMQAARERTGSAEGTFSGNALMSEAQGRRAELVSLLGQGSGVLNADEQRTLQGKIADLDAFLRQEGLTNQNTQFYDQLGISAAQWDALMNSNDFKALLGI